MAERLVFNVFKAIAFAMIFVFVFDMLSYLYSALVLNQRMESIMSSMRVSVMTNNGLTEKDAEVYQDLLYQLAADMNRKTYSPSSNTTTAGDFVTGMSWNYKTAYSGTVPSGTGVTVRKKMNEVGNFGDIQTIYVTVSIKQPYWRFGTTNSSDEFKRNASITMFKYVEFVPCMQYD